MTAPLATAAVLTLWSAVAVALCWANHRARRRTRLRASLPPPPDWRDWTPVESWSDEQVSLVFADMVADVERGAA